MTAIRSSIATTSPRTPIAAVTVTERTERDERRAVRRSLWKAGAVSGVAAGVVTTGIAAASIGLGASLAIEGEAIPVLGFGQITVLSTILGVVIAILANRWAAQPRRAFVVITVALTVVSLVPPLLIGAEASTVVALEVAHLVAAAIVIPVLASRTPATRR